MPCDPGDPTERNAKRLVHLLPRFPFIPVAFLVAAFFAAALPFAVYENFLFPTFGISTSLSFEVNVKDDPVPVPVVPSRVHQGIVENHVLPRF